MKIWTSSSSPCRNLVRELHGHPADDDDDAALSILTLPFFFGFPFFTLSRGLVNRVSGGLLLIGVIGLCFVAPSTAGLWVFLIPDSFVGERFVIIPIFQFIFWFAVIF
ncbi:hypothetical protein BV898_03594 [Hypsibius exemplaris]|uniref:Uncharacterized protein n=1 Tax=Hypsibius exemplaris TaxID=2072580 RepID=A0A1W0X541_HYPEX|nr:hypothetical protein BV898_03594 [Hypsibius exemplaris]